MKKVFLIITLFTAGFVTSCQTYEERQSEISEDQVKDVELEDGEADPEALRDEERQGKGEELNQEEEE